jgi:hypothetical protein
MIISLAKKEKIKEETKRTMLIERLKFIFFINNNKTPNIPETWNKEAIKIDSINFPFLFSKIYLYEYNIIAVAKLCLRVDKDAKKNKGNE